MRGRWHRCKVNIEFMIPLAPMTEGVSYLHENYLTIIVKLSFNSARNIKVWFSCWCATLPPLRGPPPLHSKLRRGGSSKSAREPKRNLAHKQAIEVKRYKSFPRRSGEGVSAADRWGLNIRTRTETKNRRTNNRLRYTIICLPLRGEMSALADRGVVGSGYNKLPFL